MKPIRLALSGSSGTGKTTIAEWAAKTYGLPINPVGARSVSQAMGFQSPYDVDKAGKRSEFQRRLLLEKAEWESRNEHFITDRTVLDNLAYTMLHDVHSITSADYDLCIASVRRYTHVIYCPVTILCVTGNDPARVNDKTYQALYDVLIRGLLTRFAEPLQGIYALLSSERETRKRLIAEHIASE